MSKTIKKLLSVVLAVLVLIVGFGTTFGAFRPVSAENEWTYDYTTLVSHVSKNGEIADSNNPNGEKGLYPRQGIQTSNNYVVVPDSFGIYDTNGMGVNISDWFAGLRVYDFFFSKNISNSLYTVGAESSDIHPYITYEVESGTEFRIQYYTYTKDQWAEFNLADKADEFYFVDIFASSDGVNFVPVNAENQIIARPIVDYNYDLVTAVVENVGVDTKYIKVQSSVNADTVTYKQNDTKEWTYNYVPQDALFIQKVALTAPNTTDASVNVVSFVNKTTTVNGEVFTGADARELFLSSPYTHDARDGGFHTFGDDLYDKTEDVTWQHKYPWNTFAENDRDYYLRVQPGTRFVLGWSNYGAHDDIAKALVGAYPEQYKTPEDFAIKVYTTDNLAGEWTEHRMALSSNHTNFAMYFTYNFIVPQNHSYVRIVTPISGSIGSIMKLDENGDPMESSQVNAISNSAGDDWCLIDSMTYTPFSYTYNKVYNYAANGTTTTDIYYNSGWGNGSGSGVGFAQNWASRGDYAYTLGDTDTERTDEQLLHLIYKVAGDSFFSATLDLKYASGIWYKTGYDAAKSENAEEMHFKIQTSVDGYEWTTQATLGLGDDLYMRDTRSNALRYDIGVYVPQNHNFVKIVSYCRGQYASGANSVAFNNTFAVSGAAFTTSVTQLGEIAYPYNDVATYPYGTDYATSEDDAITADPITSGAVFNSITSAVSSGNVTLDNWKGNAFGITMLYGAFGKSEDVAKKAGDGDRPYLVYRVKPGTVFKANLNVNYTIKGNAEREKTNLNKDGTVKMPFEFYISISDSVDGTYTQVYKTNTTSTHQNHDINVFVPENASFVKIEWPQTGWCLNANATNPVYEAQNHMAKLYHVTYVPFNSEVVLDDTNDYTTKGEVSLDHNESKVAYEIYDFGDVEGTANGLTAKADGAYAIYKVGNGYALEITTDNELDIEVSYDNESYVDAQLSAYAGKYTVNVLEGKQYVKVNLDAGETITAVKADALNPTATFINAAGTVKEVDTAYGAAPVVPEINTERAGYTFTKWSVETANAIYLDTEYVAEYEKAEETFAIKVENGTITSVAGTPCEDTEADARFDDRVVIEAPVNYNDGNAALVFDRWVDADGRTVSNSHKFSFLVSGDISLRAEYAEEKSSVTAFIYNSTSAIITDNGAKWNMSVTWSVNVPAGTTIKETGIILGAAAETTLEKDAEGTYALKHSSVATGKTLMYTVNNIADGATRYARPYAVLADDTVIYGEVVTATDAQ